MKKNTYSFGIDSFFNQSNSKKSQPVGQKQQLSRDLMEIFTDSLTQKFITLSDYEFLTDYVKSRGPIVRTEKYLSILKSLETTSNHSNIITYSTLLFPHIHKYITNDTIDTNKIFEKIKEMSAQGFEFTENQSDAIKLMMDFIYNTTERTFGLYGYAGTGKTTTITKLLHFLIQNNYVRSVVFTAPTNKAVDIIKAKFYSDLNTLIKDKLGDTVNKHDTFDDLIDKLEDKGYKINFLTIHKLLKYKNDFDIEGERVFIKGDKSSLTDYDLVIVDESSMIPQQIVYHLLSEAFKERIDKKYQPKVLFIGDLAQLPPVNESTSIIFAKNKETFSYEQFKSVYLTNNNGLFQRKDINLTNMISNEYNRFQKWILDMKYIVLTQVMRASDNYVVGACNEMRACVLNEISLPKFSKYRSPKVCLYLSEKEKTKTKWFQKAIEYFTSKKNQQTSNIILTWTNEQAEEYNKCLRQALYKRENLNKFEVGDILVLTDFYNLPSDSLIDGSSQFRVGEVKRFYTSDQIKVMDIDHVIKACPEFSSTLDATVKLNNHVDVREKYARTIKNINQKVSRKYHSWKLFVQRLSETQTDKVPEIYNIYVCDDKSLNNLMEDRKHAATEIRSLRNYYINMYREMITQIDKHIILPLWKELNNRLVNPFAKVTYGGAITVHKSQGSGFHNVFVDIDDILKNTRIDEAKRCCYTAQTRTSNELHMLLTNPKIQNSTPKGLE